MIRRLHWRDAEAAARWLGDRAAARRTLLLLAQLPLAPESTIERLAGLRGSTSVYRTLLQLREAGLVAAIRPPFLPGCAPQLLYLTDLGLAAVAIDQGVEPEHLARQNRLRGRDLLSLLPGLPQLIALHKLLAALAKAQPGQPKLMIWQRPWRRRFHRPTAKEPVSLAFPAYAAFASENAAGAYLLQPDLGRVPLRVYRSRLDHLLVLRGREPLGLPALVIATTDAGRADAWRALIEDVRRARREMPLAAHVTTWDDLPGGLHDLAPADGHHPPTHDLLVRRVGLRALKPRRATQVLPGLVGDALDGSATRAPTTEARGKIALELTDRDRALLDLIGRHPFLTAERVAALLGWQMPWARRRLHRLIAQGLACRLEVNEVGATAAALEPVELTAEGLALAAAQQGLSLSMAVRHLGLAGGGRRSPVGARRQLVANLAHTLGADGIFVRLARSAMKAAEVGSPDALQEWQNAAACSRGHFRPDGYGIYHHGGRRYGFFLEYDRGTMGTRDYLQKFGAYYGYLVSQRYEREYDGFPTILMVTSDNTAEERIAQAAQLAAVGRGVRLPLLLTNEWRIDDERNPDGLLGTIWREANGTWANRRGWLLEPGTTPPTNHLRSRTASVAAPGARESGKSLTAATWSGRANLSGQPISVAGAR